MVELGDLREGIMPAELDATVAEVLRLPNIALVGLGANLACQSGVTPDAANMAELSDLVEAVEANHRLRFATVSGGNSANLEWALSGAALGRINDLRLGESILLGREPLHRRPIDGLHTDAITLVAEVIESKVKPSRPLGRDRAGRLRRRTRHAPVGQADRPTGCDAGDRAPGHRSARAAAAEGDRDPRGQQRPPRRRRRAPAAAVGSEIRFQLDYSATVRAMTSPFVGKVVRLQSGLPAKVRGSSRDRDVSQVAV